MRKWILVLLVLAVAMPAMAGEQRVRSDAGAFIMTWLLGFGSGHFYLGDNWGWAFLATEMACAVTLGVALPLNWLYPVEIVSTTTTGSPFSGEETVRYHVNIWAPIALVGGLGFLAARVTEIISIYRKVEAGIVEGRVAISPRLELSPTSAGVGIRVSW